MDMNENTNMLNRKPRRFRWALWWGLGIIVSSLAALVVYAITNPSAVEGMNAPLMKAVYSMISRFGIWPVIIYMGLVGPILEELSFRLWGNGKNWTGVVSVILMALWCLSVGWWFSLLALCAGVAILMIFKEDRDKRLFVLMLFSSVLFAVAHMGNYDGNWFVVLFGVIEKFGFGLLASYLVVNHNILWSMGLHVINNSVVTIPLVLSIGQTTTIETLYNENFTLEIRSAVVHDDSISEENSFFADADSNYYFGNTASFAGQAMIYEAMQNGIDPNGDSIRIVTDNDYPKCSFTLVYTTQPYDHHGLIVAMEKARMIEIDTIYNETDKKTVLDIKSTYDPFQISKR
ncbi:MAG: CPBP family intramembrane metalloprotease [Bacteroidales bacterium]|nr:CPBP family intramembrane metalloprotease [Bacteroidales bacterium]